VLIGVLALAFTACDDLSALLGSGSNNENSSENAAQNEGENVNKNENENTTQNEGENVNQNESENENENENESENENENDSDITPTPGVPPVLKEMIYTGVGVSTGDIYELKITIVVSPSIGRSAYTSHAGEGYVLTIAKLNGEILVSTGTILAVPADGTGEYTLKNDNGNEFSVSVSSAGDMNAITSLPNEIPLDNGNTINSAQAVTASSSLSITIIPAPIIGTLSNDQLTVNFTVEVSGINNGNGHFNDMALVVSPVAGLSFNGHNATGNGSFTKQGVKTFYVTITYDGVTEFPSGKADIVITGLTNIPSGYAYSEGSKSAIVIFESNGIAMVWINPGTFIMGSDKDGDNNISSAKARPAHKVTLTTGFYMGKYEVTQEQYQAIMGNNPSYFQGEDSLPGTGEVQEKRPVENVSWYDAIRFCNKLSEAEGLETVYILTGNTDYPTVTANFSKNGYRLPTEAQWEYACRAGTTTAYYTGDGIDGLEDTAWYSANSENKTHEVGQKAPNPWGLYDMNGNVMEWCWDWYDFYIGWPETDPVGSPGIDRTNRIIRAGSWNYSAEYSRSAVRHSNGPSGKDNYVGFRLVRP
jgi:formylglycine-generating enzyme required for sulfatase activity